MNGEPPIWSPEALQERTGSLQLAQVLPTVIAHLEETARALSSAAEEQQLDLLHSVSHSVRTTFLLIGATQAAQIATAIEEQSELTTAVVAAAVLTKLCFELANAIRRYAIENRHD